MDSKKKNKKMLQASIIKEKMFLEEINVHRLLVL